VFLPSEGPSRGKVKINDTILTLHLMIVFALDQFKVGFGTRAIRLAEKPLPVQRWIAQGSTHPAQD
jgi:hypothetical protein